MAITKSTNTSMTAIKPISDNTFNTAPATASPICMLSRRIILLIPCK